MSDWGWTPERNLGIWRYGTGWLRPVMAAIPYLTVGLLLLMLFFTGGTLTSARGVLFELPSGDFPDGKQTDLVALVMPVRHETAVFFDDSRYLLGDEGSVRSLGESLAAGVERRADKSLLVLADRRVSVGRLLEVVAVAKKSGVQKVLVAGKHDGGEE